MNYEDISWDKKNYELFLKELDGLKDLKYKEFSSKLVFTPLEILGIRVPIMRDIAKKIIKGDWRGFLKLPKSKYYEVTFIRFLIIGYIKEDRETVLKYLKNHIVEIDNWGICDSCISNIKIMKKDREYFYPFIQEIIQTDNPWEIRVAIIALMYHYMDREYLEDMLNYCSSITNDNYYVRMGVAWLISVLFVNFREETLEYLKENKLTPWTKNKAIQKIRESYRVSDEDKNLLLNFKQKK